MWSFVPAFLGFQPTLMLILAVYFFQETLGEKKKNLTATCSLVPFRSKSDSYRRVTEFNKSLTTNLLNYVAYRRWQQFNPNIVTSLKVKI